MTLVRQAALFRNGRNQAVRIPKEFEMEGTEVMIHREGERLVLTPVRNQRLTRLLASWTPLDEPFHDPHDLPPEPEDII